MKVLGGDLYERQQTSAMVNTEISEFTENTLEHRGNLSREALPFSSRVED